MSSKIKISTYFIGLAIVIAAPLIIWHFKSSRSMPEPDVIDTKETEASDETDKKPGKYKSVMTTIFWVGESSDESNGFIPNHESYWDSYWLEHYGGIDSPDKRCGYYPCGFTPKENPFYFALPYGDRNDDDTMKESVKLIPWYDGASRKDSLIKNAWIEIRYAGKSCYAQWEDVGPFETDDFDYVFGNNKPKNTFGVSAGLDVSPAVWDCLGLKDNSITSWRFVDYKEVPAGPWKSILTIRDVSF